MIIWTSENTYQKSREYPILFLVIYTVICYNKSVKRRKKIRVLQERKRKKI